MEVKCAVGKKCLYNDKKSMAKGKINPATKNKIVGSKSVKPKVKALAQKKKAVVKSKSVVVKSAKKPLAKKPVAVTKAKVIAKTK